MNTKMKFLIVKVRKGEIHFKGNILRGADIGIFKDDGDMVLLKRDHPENTFYVTELERGIYEYRIMADRQSLTGRVVVI